MLPPNNIGYVSTYELWLYGVAYISTEKEYEVILLH
jgi:hypothetical protein